MGWRPWLRSPARPSSRTAPQRCRRATTSSSAPLRGRSPASRIRAHTSSSPAHETCPDCDAPVFEIGSCKRCGAVHVLGTPTAEGGVIRLRPRKAGSKGTWLVLGEGAGLTDEDEEAVAEDGVDVSADEAKLCTGCGALGKANAGHCTGVGQRTAAGPQAEAARRGDRRLPCLRRARLRHGARLRDRLGRQRCRDRDLALPEPPTQPRPSSRPTPGGGPQAARFQRQSASGGVLRALPRRLLQSTPATSADNQGLLAAHADEEPVAVDDVVFKTRAAAATVKHFAGGLTAQQQARIVAPWVMAEVLATDDRLVPRGPGPCQRQPVSRSGLAGAPTAAAPWAQRRGSVGLPAGAGSVASATGCRHDARRRAVEPRDFRAPTWADPRSGWSGPEAIRKVLSWLPDQGTNRRVDYVQRVLTALGAQADPTTLLTGVWAYLTAAHTPIDWLRSSTEPGPWRRLPGRPGATAADLGDR